jgi:hypothetical protein
MLNIAKGREVWFLILFSVQFVGWLIGITITYSDNLNWSSSIRIAKEMASFVILTTAITVIIVEGGAMLAERYLRRRFREGREKGRQEEREEIARLIRDWYRRQQQAIANGETFDELPPTLDEKR